MNSDSKSEPNPGPIIFEIKYSNPTLSVPFFNGRLPFQMISNNPEKLIVGHKKRMKIVRMKEEKRMKNMS